MKRWKIEWALVVVVAVTVAVAEQRMRGATAMSGPTRALVGVALPPIVFNGDSLAAATDRVVERDPFRAPGGGAPAPASGPAHNEPTVRGPRPLLTLKAIVGGPPWQAIVAGLPGRTSDAIVAPGDRFDLLVVRSIARDTVTVTGPDTTWTLTLRRSQP